eukprot:3151879-Amphidinium_carterae.2
MNMNSLSSRNAFGDGLYMRSNITTHMTKLNFRGLLGKAGMKAPNLRSMALGRTVSSGDEWRTTLDEVDRGLLNGPMEGDEALGLMGAGMVPARRCNV